MHGGRMIPIRNSEPLLKPLSIQPIAELNARQMTQFGQLAVEGEEDSLLIHDEGLDNRSPEGAIEENMDPGPSRITLPLQPPEKATPPSLITYQSLECFLWILNQKMVISHKDGSPILEYTTQFPIKQAFIYQFGTKEETSESVCLVGDTRMEIHGPTGLYAFTLPFEIKQVIPTPICLLIERVSENENVISSLPSNLFTITDPLGGVLPAILHKKEFTNEWYYPFDREGIQMIGAEKNLLVVHDPVKEAHLVYLMKKIDPGFWTTAHVTEKKCEFSNNTPRRFWLTPDKINSSASSKMAFQSPMIDRRGSVRGPDEKGKWDFIRILTQRRFTPLAGAVTPLSVALSTAESIAGPSTMQQPTAFWPSHYPKIHDIDDYKFGDTLFNEFNGADICIELFFSEKAADLSAKSPPARKMFLTSDIVGNEFLALLIPLNEEQCELRLYNLAEMRRGKILMEAISCKDAVSLGEPGFMLLLDLNSNLQLYSGIKRLCLVALCEEPTRSDIFFQNSINGFFWRSHSRQAVINFARFPNTFCNTLCKQIWEVIVGNLPPEKALSLVMEMRGTLNQSQNVNEEIQRFFYLFNQQLGIKFGGDFWNPEFNLSTSTPDLARGEEIAAKVPRPPQNPDDIAKWALSYDVDQFSSSSKPLIKYEYLPNAPLSSDIQRLLSALHTLYETRQIFKRNPPGFEFFARTLYALNSLFASNDRCKIYAFDEPSLRNLTFTPEIPSEMRRRFEKEPLYVPGQIEILMHQKALTALPSNVSKEVAVLLLALATAYERVNRAGDLLQYLGDARRFFKDHPIGKSSLTSAMFLNKPALERLEYLLGEFPTILEFSTLSPMLGFLLKFKLFQLSENSRFLKKEEITFHQQEGISSNEEGRLICRYRWPHDIRLCNVESMLDNSRPTFIPKRNTQNEADAREMYDQFVLTVAIRTMTLAFGIAALKLRSFTSHVDRSFDVSGICFSGRSFPENRPIELNIGEGLRSVRDWGDFYNGVATGLSIRAADEHVISEGWIQNIFAEHSKPPSSGGQAAADRYGGKPSPASAGLLLGLGLNNHLPVLNIYNVHQMLAEQDKFTSVALLLGYGASKVGTGDEQVHRILVTHISFLMGPTLLDVNIDNCVQASAILSLGLLFAQRGTTSLINKLLNEMGKAPYPDSEPSHERYAYVLSIGMAIGFAGLGKGFRHIPQVPIAEAKPGIIERLLIMMEGGPRSRAVFNTDVWSEHLGPFEESQPSTQSNHCKEIFDRINLHVTGHPATIALGLLFMKTHNRTVEFLLKLPDSLPELEKIRADVVPVRVIARALVYWDEIQPTREWIMAQVPKVVLNGANNAIGLSDPLKNFSAEEEDYWDTAVDRETVAQSYIHCVSAACFAVALKFASTCLSDVKQLFMEFNRMLILSDCQLPGHARLIRLAEKGAVAVSRNLLISALGILMAGSGDVEVLRLCHYLRRADPVANWYKNVYTHSIQAAIHTTLGMLFLGNARYSFGQSDLAIASLVVAFYPIVGHHAGDHRMYLQPFRFLWVLAVERRLIYTMDARNTTKMCRVPLRICVKDPTSGKIKWMNDMTPCLLPPLAEVESISVGGAQFEMKKMNKAQVNEVLQKQNGCIYLQRAKRYTLKQTAQLNKETRKIEREELEMAQVWKWTPSIEKSDTSSLKWRKAKVFLDQARAEPDSFDSQGILTNSVVDLYQSCCNSERLLEKRDVRIAKAFLKNECNSSVPSHFIQKLVDVAESENSADEIRESALGLPTATTEPPLSPFTHEELIFSWRFLPSNR